jgi:catechol 2,3-dioxygenase-like lactoylglutathione lyase family enzyme
MGIDIRGMAPLLQVFDMPTSIAFYRDALGFEVVTTSKPRGEHFDWALLRLNGVELMLNTAYEEDARPPAPDPARICRPRRYVSLLRLPGRRFCVRVPACAGRCRERAQGRALRYEAVVRQRSRRV